MFIVKSISSNGFENSKSFVYLKDASRYYNANKSEGVNIILVNSVGVLIEGSKSW